MKASELLARHGVMPWTPPWAPRPPRTVEPGTPAATVEIERMDQALARMRARGHHLQPDVEIDGQPHGYHALLAAREALASGEPVTFRDVAPELVARAGRGLGRAAMASDAARRAARKAR